VLDIDAKFSPARRILEEVYATWGTKEAVAEREKALSLSVGRTGGIYRRRFRSLVTRAFCRAGWKAEDSPSTATFTSYTASRSPTCDGKSKRPSMVEKAYEEHDSAWFPGCEPMFESIGSTRDSGKSRRMKLSR